MSSSYTVESLDLSAARDRTPIASTLANPVATVYAAILPGQMSVHFGQGGQAIPMVQGKQYRPCPGEKDGVFFSNVASSGSALVVITYETGSISIEGQDESLTRSGLIAYGRAAQPGSVNSGPAIQLHNPAASGKVILVSRISCAVNTNGTVYLVLHRKQIGNSGGGVLTNGAKRFLDRFLAPANPITVVDDAGISGLIRGTTFDNNFFTEFGLAPGVAANFPIASAFMFLLMNNTTPGEFLAPGQLIRLPPGWGCTTQHGPNGVGVQLGTVFYGVEGGS